MSLLLIRQSQNPNESRAITWLSVWIVVGCVWLVGVGLTTVTNTGSHQREFRVVESFKLYLELHYCRCTSYMSGIQNDGARYHVRTCVSYQNDGALCHARTCVSYQVLWVAYGVHPVQQYRHCCVLFVSGMMVCFVALADVLALYHYIIPGT